MNTRLSVVHATRFIFLHTLFILILNANLFTHVRAMLILRAGRYNERVCVEKNR